MNARSLILALPLLAAFAAPAAAQRDGLYDVTGTNLDGTPYTGVAQIQQAGLASFVIRWRVGGQVVEGRGFASGRTIAVTYGPATQPGIGIYTLHPDGSLDGEWTIVGGAGIGRERLALRGAPAAPTATPTPTPAPAQAPAPAPAPAAAPAPEAAPTAN